jgi:hypothetical protein
MSKSPPAPETDDVALTQFLLGMAESLPPPPPDQFLGHSIQKLLEDGHFTTENPIRCICGVSIAFPDEGTITCCMCSHLLHASCLTLPDHFDPRTFTCPICQFRARAADPLHQLSDWLGLVHTSIGTIGERFERANQIYSQMRARDVEAARLDPYQSFYRTDALDARNAQDVITLSRGCTDLRDHLAALESQFF